MRVRPAVVQSLFPQPGIDRRRKLLVADEGRRGRPSTLSVQVLQMVISGSEWLSAERQDPDV